MYLPLHKLFTKKKKKSCLTYLLGNGTKLWLTLKHVETKAVDCSKLGRSIPRGGYNLNKKLLVNNKNVVQIQIQNLKIL